MKRSNRDPLAIEVGSRVRLFRMTIPLTSDGFAIRLAIKPSRLAVYEIGRVLLPPSIALEIKGIWGIPLDWIYEGDTKNLPALWYNRIVPREQQEEDRKELSPSEYIKSDGATALGLNDAVMALTQEMTAHAESAHNTSKAIADGMAKLRKSIREATAEDEAAFRLSVCEAES